MKKSYKSIALTLAAAVMTLTACFPEANPAPAYQPAAQENGALVYFVNVPTGTVKLAKGTPSLDITLARASSELSALDVAITATGDAITYFNVPAKASFATDQKETKITISAKDVNAMPMNEYYELALTITDDALTSQYGSNNFSIKLGIELPWIKFDDGTIYETPYWGEQENIPLYYQQVSDNIRYCVVSGCFGHDTGAGYPVQDYTWYWNTETNQLYIPVQWMGYSNSNGKTYFGDETAFYNLYWAMKNGAGYGAGPMGPGAGQVEGTDEWFAFCDAFRAAYPEDYYPYYDGKGNFYLADQYIAGYPGDNTYLGRYLADGNSDGSDMYVCSFAADYTIGLSYEGLLISKDGNEQVMGNLEIVGGDVTDVYVVLVPGKDPSAAILALEGDGTSEVNLEEVENCIVLNAAGSFLIPMIEEAEAGKYTIVAVPVDADGAFTWDYGVYETFQYGEDVDPLAREYDANSIVADIASVAELEAVAWDGYAIELGSTGWAAERTNIGPIVFADAEDADDEDLLTVSGLSAGAGPYYGFDDTILCDLYAGVIYTHKTSGSFTLGANTYYYRASWYDSASDSVYDINYAMIGGYVADGLIAFVPYPGYLNQYGIAFDGVIYDAFTDEGFENSAGSLAGIRSIILADSTKYTDPNAVVAAVQKKVLAPGFASKSVNSLGKSTVVINNNPAKDVVASGRVLGGSKNREIVNGNYR